MNNEPQKLAAEQSEWKHFWKRTATVVFGGVFIFVLLPCIGVFVFYWFLILVVRPNF